MAKGNIIAAVAVLLIHMDRKAVTANSINTATFILPRDRRNRLTAILRSRRCMCRAVASAKPPKKM